MASHVSFRASPQRLYTTRGSNLVQASAPITRRAGWARLLQQTTAQRRSSTSSPSYASSVSSAEVSHFSRLASSWWDPHGPSRLLHLMNPLRHDFIVSCLSTAGSAPGTQLSYLDIGCGGGIFSASAARLPSTGSVLAIDPTNRVIEVAKVNQRSDPALAEPKLEYRNCAIEDLPGLVSGNGADIVTLFEVLEHVSSPTDFLLHASRHVKPGGWLVGSTIARSPLSFLTTKLIAEAPFFGVVPRGTHDWRKYINPDELRRWFGGDQGTQGGVTWSDLRTQGVVYVPALGWKMVRGSEGLGNYFFGVQRVESVRAT